MPRASGKTTLLIEESAKTGRPIIEPNIASARYVEEQARKMGLKIPEPISATSWNSGYYRGSNFNRIDGFLIDEVDSVLANIFGKPISTVTYTPEKIGGARAYDGKVGIDEFEKMLDNMEKALDRLEKNLDEKEKEKKMSKFKVGDIVRVKPVEEMLKSDIMAKSLEEYACTQHRVNTIRVICETTLYVLDDCDEVYFDEIMLEDRIYSKDDIFNINVIVPDKVVEIEFYDGKEKMVCYEDDTFDLRKCCFIAIAKHLYKETYTFEGIEYMAGQLMYQKKYVKIVDKALKEDAKKRLDMLRKAREEKELAKIKKNRERKRQRRLEKKRQERKDFLVEAIVEAMSKTVKSDANNGKHNKKK